jgi:NCS1 family nucleobase:cation symporter-1
LALWIGMVMAVPGYMLVAGLIDQGMSAGQAVGVVLLGNLIVLIPMVLIGHAGAKYGVPYAVLGRASWPWPGRWSPAVGTASRHGSAAGRCSHFLASRSAIGWRARQYRCWA